MPYPTTTKGKADLAADIIQIMTGKKGLYKNLVISQKDAMDAIDASDSRETLIENLASKFAAVKTKDLNKVFKKFVL